LSNIWIQKFILENSKYAWIGNRLSFSEPVPFPNKRAIQVLNRAAVLQRTEEDIVNVNNWLGDLYRLNSYIDSARFFYSMALFTTPENPSLRQGFADFLQESNYLFESYQLLDTLHSEGQLLFAKRPLYTTMSIYANQLDSAAAMIAWLQQSRLMHKDSLALLRGNLYFMKSANRQAIAFTKDSLQNIIPDGERYYRMAALYARSGQQKDAFTWLEKSLKNGFTYGHVIKYDPVWNTYSESGNWKKLVAKFEKGFKKYPVEEKDKMEGIE
jgi:tetratricopeptide (TPR) repeat protein